MVHESKVMHELHKRKRVYSKGEKYPHPIKYKRVVDRLAYAAGIISPIITLPQLYDVLVKKTAQGVSLTTWFFYVLISIVMFTYGLVHKEKPLMFMYGAHIIINGLITIGIIFYG